MSHRTARIATALIVLTALDLFVILVTGTTSPLLLGQVETGAWGVAARAATLLGLVWLRYGVRRRGRHEGEKSKGDGSWKFACWSHAALVDDGSLFCQKLASKPVRS